MPKKHKVISLYESEIILGNKLCNLRDRNFSTMVGELIKEEAIKNGITERNKGSKKVFNTERR